MKSVRLFSGFTLLMIWGECLTVLLFARNALVVKKPARFLVLIITLKKSILVKLLYLYLFDGMHILSRYREVGLL